MKFVASPNYTPGRQGKAIKYVVIHWMVGTLSSTDAVFKNSATQTSAHYGIENNTVHQYVKETNTAYHAGTWNANLQSIGIEHSAAPGRPATASTYKTSIKLITEICKRYNLNPDKAIVPHQRFVATQCPGTMDLNKIKAGVKTNLKGGNVSKDKATKTEVDRVYLASLGRHVDKSGLKTWTGKPINKVLDAVRKSKEWKIRNNKVKEHASLVKQVADLKAKLKNSDPTSNDQQVKDSLFEKVKKAFGKE